MKLPRLREHLVRLQCDITIIATDWFLCLFATVLPSEVCAAIALVWLGMVIVLA